MSGENVYNLLARDQARQEAAAPMKGSSASPYTGHYSTHMKEMPKPTYSTFYEKGKEYDGTNVRFFKQRDAIIGKSVAESVYPANYLKKGGGVRAVVPPVHKEKIYTKPSVDDRRAGEGVMGNGSGNSNDNAGGLDNGQSALLGDGRNGDGQDGNGSGASAQGANTEYTGFPSYEHEGGIMGVSKARKNFIASNIVEVSNMVPKNRKDQPKYATDRKSFGQTPAYLGRVKQEVETEKSLVCALDDQKTQRRQQIYDQYVYKLPADEQAHLIAKLKENLQRSSSALASMPFSLDTASAAKKKSELQRTIKDIEGALGKLEKEAIFIYRDDPVNGQWTKNAALEEAKQYVVSYGSA